MTCNQQPDILSDHRGTIGVEHLHGNCVLLIGGNGVVQIDAQVGPPALIPAATGKVPYYVGKPNPIMLRNGLNKIDAHSEETALIGDRMDTDMLAGMEAGLQTHLVLSGSTARDDIGKFAFRPDYVHEGIGELLDLI